MAKKDNIRVFDNVKIYGYDPNHEPDQYGYYSVTLYISQEQKDFINDFVYGKCDINKDGEIIYRAKSKKQIPLFDSLKNEIKTGVDTFMANVSLLFDEFTNDKDETIRYIKPLAIKYIFLVPNEAVRIYVKEEFKSYDDCFPEESNEPKTQPDFSAMQKPGEIGQAVTPSAASTFEPTIPPMDDLPF